MMKFKTHSVLLCALAFLGGLSFHGIIRAEEKQTAQEKAEAKEAADEDERESKMDGEARDPLKYLVVKGTMALDESAKGPVIGTISGKDGTYQIKLTNESIRAQMFKYNNKIVTLGGKLRNNGKYILVKEIILGQQPAVSLSDPRGL